MNQTNARTAEAEGLESTALIAWPTIGATAAGRWVGRLAGVGSERRFLRLGKLWALLTIPVSLGAYVWKVMPCVYRRYRITNRRVVIDRGLGLAEDRSIGLDQFDSLQIDVRPGHQWLRSGDVVFRRDGVEVFRLPSVAHPAAFREVCLKGQAARLAVRAVLQQQEEVAQGQ